MLLIVVFVHVLFGVCEAQVTVLDPCFDYEGRCTQNPYVAEFQPQVSMSLNGNQHVQWEVLSQTFAGAGLTFVGNTPMQLNPPFLGTPADAFADAVFGSSVPYDSDRERYGFPAEHECYDSVHYDCVYEPMGWMNPLGTCDARKTTYIASIAEVFENCPVTTTTYDSHVLMSAQCDYHAILVWPTPCTQSMPFASSDALYFKTILDVSYNPGMNISAPPVCRSDQVYLDEATKKGRAHMVLETDPEYWFTNVRVDYLGQSFDPAYWRYLSSVSEVGQLDLFLSTVLPVGPDVAFGGVMSVTYDLLKGDGSMHHNLRATREYHLSHITTSAELDTGVSLYAGTNLGLISQQTPVFATENPMWLYLVSPDAGPGFDVTSAPYPQIYGLKAGKEPELIPRSEGPTGDWKYIVYNRTDEIGTPSITIDPALASQSLGKKMLYQIVPNPAMFPLNFDRIEIFVEMDIAPRTGRRDALSRPSIRVNSEKPSIVLHAADHPERRELDSKPQSLRAAVNFEPLRQGPAAWVYAIPVSIVVVVAIVVAIAVVIVSTAICACRSVCCFAGRKKEVLGSDTETEMLA